MRDAVAVEKCRGRGADTRSDNVSEAGKQSKKILLDVFERYIEEYISFLTLRI